MSRTRIVLWVDDEPSETSPDLHTIRLKDGRALLRVTDHIRKILINQS